MRIFGHRRRPLTESELLDRIARCLRAAYAPTLMWQCLLCLVVIAAVALVFGQR